MPAQPYGTPYTPTTSGTGTIIQGPPGPRGASGAPGSNGGPGPAGVGVPTGGTAGQALTKIDGTNYNTHWSAVGIGDALTTGTLAQFAATTSAQLRGVLSDETGSGAAVFATSPTLTTPALGTPSALVLTNATGLPAASITGTIAQAMLGTGSDGSGTHFLADDQTYKTVSSGVSVGLACGLALALG